MDVNEQTLEWAEGHIRELRSEMTWKASSGFAGGRWVATGHEATDRIRARATSALAFLERYTGADSRWTQNAHGVFDELSINQSMESGSRAIGGVINEWTRAVRSGQAQPRLVESLGARAVASTDLLEQVRALNADKSVIPAAPIVLAGAALEIALRSAVEELSLTFPSKPGISAYAKVLRSSDVLNKQDMKDVEQMAGLRNQAAHGDHKDLSHERSGLMEQQVNFFCQETRAGRPTADLTCLRPQTGRSRSRALGQGSRRSATQPHHLAAAIRDVVPWLMGLGLGVRHALRADLCSSDPEARAATLP